MLDKKYIYLNKSFESREDLFREVGPQLQEDGIVKDTFIEALIEREQEFPTGLPLPVGVAIPHTDASHVNEDRLVIITLANPIEFLEIGGDEDDLVSVSLVIMIVMNDGKSHLEMLTNIIELAQNQELIESIVSADEEDLVIDLFNKNVFKKENET
ncbi:PTS sugar transporter subunit IIA [Dolosicoccus paucivorans]